MSCLYLGVSCHFALTLYYMTRMFWLAFKVEVSLLTDPWQDEFSIFAVLLTSSVRFSDWLLSYRCHVSQ